ncbi:hypothetical protein ACQP1K_04335 [Sphaerimonospora sp. CA-214678]|uniref:hypothetical protein n=1 Tax=Sphaerimonospora sp. CA-214678 TaxID=3240029 RepID=UPI003D8ADA10
MGWFSDLLLPGRLRTGPTVLLPTRPDPKTLLAVAQLADPEAAFDGDDIIAGGSRILAAVELTGSVLAKLGIQDEERLWACRITAEGPLPVDYFDKSLAEGIAFRLGGWSLCQGEPTDPAENERRDLVVYLPAAPSPEETIEVLRELVSPAESLDADRWPDGELVDGIVRVPLREGVLTDVYMGADTVVTIEEGRRIPPAARARWPYLTEIVIAKVSPLTPQDADEPTGAADGDTTPAPETGDVPGDDAADATSSDAPGAAGGEAAEESVAETAEETAEESAAAESVAESADEGLVEAADPEAAPGDGEAGDESPAAGEQALMARAAMALTLARRLSGIAADEGGFQLAEPADLLPGRYA